MIGSTCDYSVVVPDVRVESGTTLKARARWEGPQPLMLGASARVEITYVSPGPSLLYSRICMKPAGVVPRLLQHLEPGALAVCFDVDRQITKKLRPGDVLSICRTGCGGIGLSVVRDERLVVAAGAVTSVPLGRDVAVVVPYRQMEEAGAALRQLDGAFEWHEQPVAVTIRHQTRVLFRGRPQFEGHEVFMVHGAFSGLPGTDELLSIARLDVCQPVAASTTALLLRDWMRPDSEAAGVSDVF